MVTIQIPSGKQFQLPARLLAHHSKYFRAALNSTMKEATTLHFDLVEHAGDTAVELFATWIHCHSLPVFDRDQLGHLLVDKPDAKNASIEAWRLGDYLGITEFRNDVLFVIAEQLSAVVIESHPFLESSPLLDGLDTNTALYRLLAANLGQDLLVHHDRDEMQRTLRSLDADAHAAVSEYIALDCSELFQWVRYGSDFYAMSDRRMARRLREDAKTIRKGGARVCVYGFLEDDNKDVVTIAEDNTSAEETIPWSQTW